MPEPLPQDLAKPLACSLGKLVIAWSLVEAALDDWTSTIYGHAGGDALAREMPRAFDKKRRFLKKAFAKLPALEPLRDEAQSILVEARRLSRFRNDVIHAYPASFDPASQRITFHKLQGAKRNQRQELIPVVLELAEIDHYAATSGALVPRAQEVSRRLFDTLVKQDLPD